MLTGRKGPVCGVRGLLPGQRLLSTAAGATGWKGRPRKSSKDVTIVDVSPRDGLQNEKQMVSLQTKAELIDRLVKSGVQNIEVTSFVSPKWVPQMGDAKALYPAVLAKYNSTDLSNSNGVHFSVLTPNIKGLEGALAAAEQVGKKVTEIAIFGAASEEFSQKNTNRSIADSFKAFDQVVSVAQKRGIFVRGYLSTVIACPYAGPTDPSLVAKLSKDLRDMGCYEVSLGDTIGVGTPATIERMINEVVKLVPPQYLAIHAHDTYGQGVANVLKAVDMGIRTVDTSVAGLGGCPYAKGATGNVATEDVVYALHDLGYETGIDMLELSKTGAWISEELSRANAAKAGRAIVAKANL
jgi:hydroxymethylglutaryl-CoA lyase